MPRFIFTRMYNNLNDVEKSSLPQLDKDEKEEIKELCDIIFEVEDDSDDYNDTLQDMMYERRFFKAFKEKHKDGIEIGYTDGTVETIKV